METIEVNSEQGLTIFDLRRLHISTFPVLCSIFLSPSPPPLSAEALAKADLPLKFFHQKKQTLLRQGFGGQCIREADVDCLENRSRNELLLCLGLSWIRSEIGDQVLIDSASYDHELQDLLFADVRHIDMGNVHAAADTDILMISQVPRFEL